jgi:HlyD family secretion protein
VLLLFHRCDRKELVLERLCALFLCLLLACEPGARRDPPSSAVVLGDFVVALELAGELEATSSVSLVVPDIGTGAQVTFLAPEGARVAEGEVVVELDRSALDRQLIDAGNNLEIARTRIGQQQAQLELRLADLASAVERSKLALEGAQMRVTDSEAVPRVERDAARLDVQAAALALDQARANLEQARLQGEAQLELLAIQARQGRELVERTQARRDATTLLAPADGVVVHVEAPEGRPLGQGYMVYPGTKVVELADPSELQVATWVHELDAGRLREGQRAAVVLEAHPERTLEGRVVSISDMAVRRSPLPGKRLRTIIALEHADPSLRPGMSVRAEIEVERLAEVLSVPREAVFQRSGSPCVLRQQADGWSPVPIQPGSTNDTHVVVTGALQPGDRVALVDPGTDPAQGEAAEAGS